MTCLRCGLDLTFNEWWAGDCHGPGARVPARNTQVPVLADTSAHLLAPGQFPRLLCLECGERCPDDLKVAGGGKCGPCSCADEEVFSYA